MTLSRLRVRVHVWCLALALFLAVAHAAGQSQRYDLVIPGGGPSGYAAAIRGAQLGLKVLVIEKYEPSLTDAQHADGSSTPDRSRIQELLLHQRLIGILRTLEVDLTDESIFTAAQSFSVKYVNRENPVHAKVDSHALEREPAHTNTSLWPMVLNVTPAGVGSIEGIPRAMRKVAARKRDRIDPVEGREVVDIQEHDRGVTVTAVPHHGSQYRASLPAEAADRPESWEGDMVYVATGARSIRDGRLGKILGVTARWVGRPIRMVNAIANRPGGGRALVAQIRDERGDHRTLVGGGVRTTITAELPKGVELETEADVRAFLAQDMHAIDGSDGLPAELDLAQPPSKVFEAGLSRASKFLVGRTKNRERIILGGDAGRTVSPWAGVGVNSAIMDGFAVAEFVAALKHATSDAERNDLYRAFRAHTRSNGFAEHFYARVMEYGLRFGMNDTVVDTMRTVMTDVREVAVDGAGTLGAVAASRAYRLGRRLQQLRPGGWARPRAIRPRATVQSARDRSGAGVAAAHHANH